MSNIRVTYDTNLNNARSESSVVINPNDPTKIVCGSKKFKDIHNYDFTLATAYSPDGGFTWYDSADLPMPDFSLLTDPALAWDDIGNVFLVGLSGNNPPDFDTIGIEIYKSTDRGKTWSAPNRIHTSVGDDKQWAAGDGNPASLFHGRVYAVWDDGSDMRFARTKDHGATWVGAGAGVTPPGTVLANDSFSPEINVAANGDVYIVWIAGSEIGQIKMIVSRDGGDSFHTVAPPATGVTTLYSMPAPHDSWPVFPGGNFRVLTLPTACVFGQTVTVAWADFRERVSRIYYALSINGGASWITGPSGQPLLTGTLPANLQHFHPQIIADPNGVIGCAFYEFGPKPSTPLIDVIMAQSLDGGASFNHFTLTDQPWDPAVDAPWSHGDPNVTFIGDYFGLDASVWGFYPLWTDTRTGIQELWTDIVPKKDCIIYGERYKLGKDEIDAYPEVDAPFYVIIDGFSADELNITRETFTDPQHNPSPSISFDPGLNVTCKASACDAAVDENNFNIRQRFTWTFTIAFKDSSDFTPEDKLVTLTASITSKSGVTVSGQAVITLTLHAEPFEIDGPVPWLSRDLQVFQIQPGQSLPSTPTVPMGNDPNDFIKNLIDKYNDPTLPRAPNHPFDVDLVARADASAVEITETISDTPVYNFAVARVRYRGQTPAENVRVFFRLFQLATTSTDFQSKSTYKTGGESGKKIPVLGLVNGEVRTIPCFADPRIDPTTQSMNAQPDPKNVQKISPDASGAEVQAYFGCWLDINQTTAVVPVNPTSPAGPFPGPLESIQQAVLRSPHQCLVAEINFDTGSISEGQTPANSDKLAQRNLAIDPSANPGDSASHRILQTFDIRPTAASLSASETPDELMIDWGDVPADSEASIYLPGASADTILATANALYAHHGLSRVDDHTLGCQARGITYIPIPPGVGSNFAGLLTIDLPPTVRKGQAFKVVTRQITNTVSEISQLQPGPRLASARPKGEFPEKKIKWRQTVGTFQVTIPVSTKEALLKPALRQLAVLKYIQQSIPADSRWSPVFGRYLQGLADRVSALGGNPDAVLPSPAGDVQNGKPFAKGVPYLGTWLVLGPIFDPAHQPGSHFDDVPRRPRAGGIILDIDNHKDQLDPLGLTTPDRAPNHGDVVRYGGQGIDGNTVLAERVYTWRKRYFGGLDWDSLNDIRDDVHTHLGGDYDDDPFDPYDYLNFAGKHHALVLLLVYIISPDERTTRIALRYDDAVRVWLNGAEIKNDALPYLLDHDIIDEDETFAEITLRSGTNVLLVAVAETHVEWGFSARIEDYEGLRFTADNPSRDPIAAFDSDYRHVGIAGGANSWNPEDPNRVLSYIGNGHWQGRVRMMDELFKIVGHERESSHWWGPRGSNIVDDNFWNELPGVYDVTFDQNNPTQPVFILVKPFGKRA